MMKASNLKTGLPSLETVQSASSTYSSVSKTDESTKSGGSTKSQKDEDFTKENAFSPIDLESIIQTERLTKLLNEAVDKTKLVVGLPKLAQQGTLKSFLTHPHYEEVMFFFELYNSNLFSSSVLSNVDELKLDNLWKANRLNPEQARLINILNRYSALIPSAQNIIEEMKESYKSFETKPAQPQLEFLLHFERFREIVVAQLHRSAATELQIKAKTNKIVESNAAVIQKINEYKTSLEEEKISFEEVMEKKRNVISQLEQELQSFQRQTDIDRKAKILQSERQMVLASRSHAVKKEILIEEEDQTRQCYENSLKTHLKKENELRHRRFKVELQFTTWMQKYDQDMTEKQEELNELTDLDNEEANMVKDLEEKLAVLDEQYIPLMEEREKEYQEEMEEKRKAFVHEHAARVIQYAWRRVLENRKEKIKLKRLIKKMQEEQERAEWKEAIKKRREEAERKKQEKLEKKLQKQEKKQRKKGDENETINDSPDVADQNRNPNKS